MKPLLVASAAAALGLSTLLPPEIPRVAPATTSTALAGKTFQVDGTHSSAVFQVR